VNKVREIDVEMENRKIERRRESEREKACMCEIEKI